MMHFIKLIRPINLLIIAITMYGVRFYVLEVHYFEKVKDNALDFFLLVFSTVIIAAAGNIINDYFDVRADRINKPERLIITKHIKRRWAILIHWIFNGIAFGIALYLSIKYQSLWFVFIHLLSWKLNGGCINCISSNFSSSLF
jgi:4-hydroxybenzoate polyprenyltransferase